MIRNVSLMPLAAAALCVTALSGCAHDYAAERSFGESVNVAIREQTIRIHGVGYDGVATGLEGSPSKAVIDRYHRSYEVPQAQGNVMNIGVGTGSALGAAAGVGMGTSTATGIGGR